MNTQTKIGEINKAESLKDYSIGQHPMIIMNIKMNINPVGAQLYKDKL